MSARIYTRSGDAGETGLFGGERVSKADLRVEAYGTVDELNAALGVARIDPPDSELDALFATLQNALLTLGADLATPGSADSSRGRVTIQRIEATDVERLEALIDRYEDELPPLTNFILPGGHRLAAQLHWCRVVCRRAERRCVALAQSHSGSENDGVNSQAIRYLNRLSDLFFVLARIANHRQGVSDVIWQRS